MSADWVFVILALVVAFIYHVKLVLPSRLQRHEEQEHTEWRLRELSLEAESREEQQRLALAPPMKR